MTEKSDAPVRRNPQQRKKENVDGIIGMVPSIYLAAVGDSFGLHPSLIDTVSVSAIYRFLNPTSKHERSPAFPRLLSLFLYLI